MELAVDAFRLEIAQELGTGNGSSHNQFTTGRIAGYSDLEAAPVLLWRVHLVRRQ
jgi:hypothetical protein